jgi:hypothetical protein
VHDAGIIPPFEIFSNATSLGDVTIDGVECEHWKTFSNYSVPGNYKPLETNNQVHADYFIKKGHLLLLAVKILNYL